jgi:hypothetical protein
MFACKVYDRVFTAPNFELLLNKVDAYGEDHGLYAASVVSYEVPNSFSDFMLSKFFEG